MVCACFSPKLEMYDTFSGRQTKQAARKKAALKNIKDLKSLIGSPKDFIHHDHLGLDDAHNFTSRPSNQTEATSSYLSSPVFSCMVVSTPTSPNIGKSPTVEHPVFSTREADRHKVSIDISTGKPVINRIRRKSVPYYSFQSESQASDHSLPDATELTVTVEPDRDVESRGPLDGKGRPLHRIGGEYMTQTTKFKWDKQMEEIATALKDGAEEPESIRGLEPS